MTQPFKLGDESGSQQEQLARYAMTSAQLYATNLAVSVEPETRPAEQTAPGGVGAGDGDAH
jgi:hypothetical protein